MDRAGPVGAVAIASAPRRRAGMRSAARITLDVAVAFVILLVVAVGVGILGVTEGSERVTRRRPGLR